ncbi:MAG: precorrin-3B C(17)-methyltransferase [Alphaproteobacteria bacterium]|nr:precorrin-3B C(17)-methyltransferase [Alphaproteobacteria bacterium]
MSVLLPGDIAIVTLGAGGAALGGRLRACLPGARLHGPGAYPGAWDECYTHASQHIARLFQEGRPVIGLCASGILIRAVAPLLASKQEEPPLVAVAEDGSVAVPLIGGHRGGNLIARAIAEITGGSAAITTAGDLRLALSLDEPPPGWRIANPQKVKPVAAALLRGEPVSLIEDVAGGGWLHGGRIGWADGGEQRVIVTDRASSADGAALVFHPPVLALGIGCERGCSGSEIAALVRSALAEAGLAPAAIAVVVSIELKAGEAAIHALADELGVPARFFPASRLLAETPRLSERSQTVFRATGCWGVAEGAALAAAGPDGVLVLPKRKSRHATCALARAAAPIAADAIGRARGKLAVIGIGPGKPAWRTPEANAALAQASDVVGYGLYLDLLGRDVEGKRRHTTPIGEEEARVRLALDLAAQGRSVALVSSGDAGIYGLAPLVFELVDRAAKPEWRRVELLVCPGLSALQAAAALAGAPLGHDFCAISLSDLMTPWEAICARIEAAAAADFIIALYNPCSTRRRARLAEAADILRRHRAPQTPVFIGRNLGRDGEERNLRQLRELAGADIDMLTIVLVGSRRTRRIDSDPPYLYTPRGYLDGARR